MTSRITTILNDARQLIVAMQAGPLRCRELYHAERMLEAAIEVLAERDRRRQAEGVGPDEPDKNAYSMPGKCHGCGD